MLKWDYGLRTTDHGPRTTDYGPRTRGQMAYGNGEHSQIFPVQHTNGINANDPLYQFRSMPYLLCWTAESKVNCDENY
jgi:hypothetical protein